MQIPAVNTSRSYALNNTLLHSRNQRPFQPPCESHQSVGQDASCANQSVANDNTQPQHAARELSEDEQRQLAQLKVTDREVHAHEAAHIAAAGGLVRGGASFSYQAGPDGRMYAVGGEVSIDTSAVAGNPQATIQKAQTIRAAALAPAQPSSADHAAAAAAGQLEAAARLELAAKQAEQQRNPSEHKAVQNAETAAAAANESDAAEPKPGFGIIHYQQTSNPGTPSDLIGKRLDTTA